ncbi:MAG: hypothetical protein WCR42_14465 [bacterium]
MVPTPEPSFFERFGALVIAILALVQPWAFYLWKKYFIKGKIDFCETGNIEIGLSSFAATIGLNGTLVSINKDQFVSKIHLTLSKVDDNSIHKFEWGFFLGSKFRLSDLNDNVVELPYGFLLSTNAPLRLNIQFWDTNQLASFRQITNNLGNDWNRFLEKCYPYEKRRIDTDVNTKTFQLFEEFSKEHEFINAYSQYKELNYLKEGDYNLKIIINTARPNNEFTKSFRLKLTKDDCSILNGNILSVCELACGQYRFPWKYTYCEYNHLS